MPYQLPALPYGFDALEPHIDAKTMEIHHDKHHATYVNKLNKALAEPCRPPGQVGGGPAARLRRRAGGDPHRRAQPRRRPRQPLPVLGGHGAAAAAASRRASSPRPSSGDFGGFETFKEKLTNAAANQFGSGWGWLVVSGGKLDVVAKPNQDSPLMEGKTPILGVDVWEHAYYLKYQNRRPDYLVRLVEHGQLAGGGPALRRRARLKRP